MELWIRSQNKEILKKCDAVILNGLGLRTIIFGEEPEEYCLTDEKDVVLARYKTEERALEILDEIQEKLKNKFLCKPNCLMRRKDVDKEEEILNWKYNKDFIMQPPTIDIEPINCDIVVYEMPKE